MTQGFTERYNIIMIKRGIFPVNVISSLNYDLYRVELICCVTSYIASPRGYSPPRDVRNKLNSLSRFNRPFVHLSLLYHTYFLLN